MPKQILPKKIESLNPSLSVINPSGSYKQYAQIFGARKRGGPGRSALSKFYSGYVPGLQRVTENKKESKMKIQESISELIRNNASKHVNNYRDWETDRKSTRLNSSHSAKSRMPSSA